MFTSTDITTMNLNQLIVDVAIVLGVILILIFTELIKIYTHLYKVNQVLVVLLNVVEKRSSATEGSR